MKKMFENKKANRAFHVFLGLLLIAVIAIQYQLFLNAPEVDPARADEADSGDGGLIIDMQSKETGADYAWRLSRDSVTAWSDTSGSAIIPGAEEPVTLKDPSGVYVTVFGTESNMLSLRPRPIITSVSPSNGPAGTWVTIHGRGFGNDRGTVEFCERYTVDGVCVNGVVGLPLPTVCGDVWTDTQVIVKTNGTMDMQAYYVHVVSDGTNYATEFSDKHIFEVNGNSFAPQICAVVNNADNPISSAETGDEIFVLGAHFSDIASDNALFASSQAEAGVSVSDFQTISKLDANLIISEANGTGDVYVMSKGVRVTEESYCPINTNSGTVTYAGSEHASGVTAYDGPAYPFPYENSERIALPAGKTGSSVMFDGTDSFVYPDAYLSVSAGGKISAQINVFNHGYELTNVPFDTSFAVTPSVLESKANARSMDVVARIMRQGDGVPVSEKTVSVPVSSAVQTIGVEAGNIEAGNYYIQVLQVDEYSAECADCGPDGAPRRFETNLAVQSVTITTVAGIRIDGQCIAGDGTIVQKQPLEIPVTLTSNSVRIRINDEPQEKDIAIDDSEMPATPACPNSMLRLSLYAPCPLGSTETGGECEQTDGHIVPHIEIDTGSVTDSIKTLRYGDDIVCAGSERMLTPREKEAYALDANTVYCEARVILNIDSIETSSGLYAGLRVGISPVSALQSGAQYTVLALKGTDDAVHEKRQSEGLRLRDLRTVSSYRNETAYSFRTKDDICEVRRIDLEIDSETVEEIIFEDSSTPLSGTLTGYPDLDGTVPLTGVVFNTALNGVADKFANIEQSDSGSDIQNEVVFIPDLTGSTDTVGFRGSVLIDAAVGDDLSTLENPEAHASIPIYADACDFPWTFTDQDLNFRFEYCIGKEGFSDNLSEIGDGSGNFDESNPGGAIIEESDMTEIMEAIERGESILLKEYLFPVSD